MLRDLDPCCCRYESSCGADIEGVSTITTGTTGVNQRAQGNVDLCGYGSNDFGCSNDFIDGFALDAKGNQKTCYLGGGSIPLHDGPHDRLHIAMGKIMSIDEKPNGVLDVHETGLTVEEISEKLVPLLGQNRFRMELDTLDIKSLVTDTHDFIDPTLFILRPCGYFQAFRKA